jgi:hypothetical protein
MQLIEEAENARNIIKKAEAMGDNYILQALLGNFRKTGDPRFFNLLVKCIEDIEALERRIEAQSQ